MQFASSEPNSQFASSSKRYYALAMCQQRIPCDNLWDCTIPLRMGMKGKGTFALPKPADLLTFAETQMSSERKVSGMCSKS